MGGHGGLNILPQKRWNVYNRDNRYQVAQDEAEVRAQQESERQNHIQAERDFKRNVLLKRARKGEGAESDFGQTESDFPDNESNRMKALNKEFEKEKQELKRRGKKQERTSDARFDERFQFAYGFKGSKPWYACPKPMVVDERASSQLNQPSTSGRHSVNVKDSSLKKREERDKDKHKHKSKHLEKTSKKKISKRKMAKALLAGLNGTESGDALALLRKERLKREKAERARAKELLKSKHT